MFTHITHCNSLIVLGALLFCSACQQPDHPGQLSSFDGQSYDSLMLAHSALISLAGPISTNYPKYKPAFNNAAAGYSVAFNAYSLYRSNSQDEAAASAAVENLTMSIVLLENTIQADLNVSPGAVVNVKRRAAKLIRQDADAASTTDILTVLELAASVAETVPQAQASAALAAVVIAATTDAIGTEQMNAGKAIDLSTIQPVAPLQ